MAVEGKFPTVAKGCFIAPTACVSGDVAMGANSSVWYGAIVRGDVAQIKIGANTNISHRAVIISDSADQKVSCPRNWSL